MSKKKERQQAKRRVCHQENEKKALDTTDHDTTLGRAARRRYGQGRAK